MARGGCGSRCGGRSRRRRSCRRCGRCIRGLGVCRWSRRGGALAAAVLEVGRVPARALELEAGSRQLLGKGLGTTGRAGRQRSIRDFPQHVLGMTAGATLVCINRHGANAYTREDAKLSIIGIRPILRLPCPQRPRPESRKPHASVGTLWPEMQNASRADWHSIRAVPAPLPGRLPRPCSAPCPAPLHPHTGQHDGKAHQHQGGHPGGGDRLRR